MRYVLKMLVLTIAVGLMTACATARQETQLEETTKRYAVMVRWNEIEQAMGFIHPDALPSSDRLDFELKRFDQVRITGYDVTAVAPDQAGLVFRQTAEIRVYNKHTAVERVIVDRQLWEFDAELERWWLMSGLPRLTSRE